MSADQRELSRFAAIFAGGTMLSRVLGLGRDIAIAALIPTASKDAFIAAFRFPNMLRDLIGEGAANAALVPVLSEYRATRSEAEFRELVAAALSLMVLVLVTLTITGVAVLHALPQILALLEPFTGREPLPAERAALYTDLAVWTFPYLLFIGLAVFAMGPLFTVKHYGTPSWSPALLNVSLLAVLLVQSRFAEPAWALVIGVWLGGIAQCVVQFRALRRYCGVWKPNFRFRHPGVKQMMWLLVPVLIGQSAGEVNKLVDNLFAMSLQEGTVWGLFCANRLVQLPLSIFGLAAAAAILPTLSAAAARGDRVEMHATLLHGLRQSYFLIAPSMVGLILLREPIVRLIFERGEFDRDLTALTASALGLYAAGLLAFAWVKVLVSGFYALQDTKTPVIIASASMVLNIVLNFALVGTFQHLGLAFATTVSYTVNFLLLYFFLSAKVGWLAGGAFNGAMLRMTVALGMMTAAVYAVRTRLSVYDDDGVFGALLLTGVPMLIAGLVYFTLAYAFRIPELEYLASSVRRRSMPSK